MVAGPFCLCVAGPNGSGKTTLAGTLRSRFPPLPWIDPDEIEVELRQDQRGMPADQDLLQRLAFRAARNRRVDYAVRMRDFGFETVFSHGSNLAFLRALRAIGYEIHLVFVATDNVELNVRRVETRVHMGGHHVPEEKVRDRFRRSMLLLSLSIRDVEKVTLFDNSNPLLDIAGSYFAGRVVGVINSDADGERAEHLTLHPPVPSWVSTHALPPFGRAWRTSILRQTATIEFGDDVNCEVGGDFGSEQGREQFLHRFRWPQG